MQALIWEDKIVDYHAGLSTDFGVDRPACSSFGDKPGLVKMGFCVRPAKKYLCQIPEARRGQPTQTRFPSVTHGSWPSLPKVKVNATTAIQYGAEWSPVFCRKGHLTHVFLACDVSTSCWTRGDVTLSFRSYTWALPTSQSCPAQLAVTSLPPSFTCSSEEQKVPYSLVCDHRRDCVDGSDETFCKFPPCKWLTQFQCLNKQVCITCSNVHIYVLPKSSKSLRFSLIQQGIKRFEGRKPFNSDSLVDKKKLF